MALYEKDEHPLGTLEERKTWSVLARGAGALCVLAAAVFTLVGVFESGTAVGVLGDVFGVTSGLWGTGLFIGGEAVAYGIRRDTKAQADRRNMFS